MTGNQIAALLAEYLLERAHAAGIACRRELYVVKTLVTTDLVRRIAEAFGVRMLGELQVGFKYIGGTMDEVGPAKFRLWLRRVARLSGRQLRPRQRRRSGRDAAGRNWRPGSKAAGQTLHEKLDALYWQYRLPRRGAGLA